MIRYRLARLLDAARNAIWSRRRESIWKQHASQDQLRQIVWRLSMCHSLSPDVSAAYKLAKQLQKRIG